MTGRTGTSSSSHERRKKGWDVLAAEFDRAAAPPKPR